MNNLNLEIMKKHLSTILVVSIFAIVITISVLTNRSNCRIALHRINSSIEQLATK